MVYTWDVLGVLWKLYNESELALLVRTSEQKGKSVPMPQPFPDLWSKKSLEEKCWSLLDRRWFIHLKNTTILKDSYNDSLTSNSSAVLRRTAVLKICQRCFKSECMWHRISWHRFWIVWCELFFDHIFLLKNVLSLLSTYQCGSNGTRMHCAWQTKNFWIAGPFGNVCNPWLFFPLCEAIKNTEFMSLLHVF